MRAYTCTDEAAQHAGLVDAAINTLMAEQPQLFDLSDRPWACCPKVVDENGYVRGVAEIVSRSGFCAMQDPNAGDEMTFKPPTNEYSEGYDILTAAGYVRRPPGAYRGKCRPAWF